MDPINTSPSALCNPHKSADTCMAHKSETPPRKSANLCQNKVPYSRHTSIHNIVLYLLSNCNEIIPESVPVNASTETITEDFSVFPKTRISHVNLDGSESGITCGFSKIGFSHVILDGSESGITCGFPKTGISHVNFSSGESEITCGFSKIGFSHVNFSSGESEITCGFSKIGFSHVNFSSGESEITCGFSKTGISHVKQLAKPDPATASSHRESRYKSVHDPAVEHAFIDFRVVEIDLFIALKPGKITGDFTAVCVLS